jgi:uncharacterized phage protein gp47/JayE
MIERQYLNESDTVILERMKARIDDSLDKRQGSVVHDLLYPAAAELAQSYVALDDVIAFGLDVNEDTPNIYVDRKAQAQGIIRKPAIVSTGELTFSGEEGVNVPIGSRARTDETTPVYFVTTEEGTVVGGTVTVAAKAETGGLNGNVAPNTVVVVLGDITGISAVTNVATFNGGIDEESNQDLLVRYYEKVQRPATSGNVYQYEQWAKEVNGVGGVKVYPVWNGPGTVKLVLIDDLRTAPDASVISATQTYIESVRPIGATVTVIGATELPINVSATLTLQSGTVIEDVKTAFASALTLYLRNLAFTGELVRYSQIANLVLDTVGVIDYTNLLVNSAATNIMPADESVAVKGGVTFT